MGTGVTMDELVNDYIEDRLDDLGNTTKNEILKLNDKEKIDLISKILELPSSDRVGKIDIVNDYFESIDKETHIKNNDKNNSNIKTIEDRLVNATMKKVSKENTMMINTKSFITNLDKDSSKIKSADDYKKILDKITDKIVEINNVNTKILDKKSISNINNSLDLLQKEYKFYKSEWDNFIKNNNTN